MNETSWADYMGYKVSLDDGSSYCVRNKSGRVIDGGYKTIEEAEAARQYRGNLERRQVESGRTLTK